MRHTETDVAEGRPQRPLSPPLGGHPSLYSRFGSLDFTILDGPLSAQHRFFDDSALFSRHIGGGGLSKINAYSSLSQRSRSPKLTPTVPLKQGNFVPTDKISLFDAAIFK